MTSTTGAPTLLEPGARRQPPAGSPSAGSARPVLVCAAVAVVAVGVLVVALVVGGGGPQPVPAGLPDAGPVTGWGLPLVRLAFDVAAVGTVGTLLTAGLLVPRSAEPPGPGAAGAARAASVWAATWALLAVALLVLRVSDTTGLPLTALTVELLAQQSGTGRGPGLLGVAVVAGALAVGAGLARTAGQTRLLLGVALLALVPPTLSGHAPPTGNATVVAGALALHVAAASLWLGGLLGVVVHLRRDRAVLAPAVARFSALALAAFVGVGVSGIVTAVGHYGAALDTWATPYGALLAAKVGLLVVLGLVGLRHRRRLVPGLVAGRARAFVALALAELAVMAAVLGLAVALSRTPPPVPAAVIAEHPGAEHPGTDHPGTEHRAGHRGVADTGRNRTSCPGRSCAAASTSPETTTATTG